MSAGAREGMVLEGRYVLRSPLGHGGMGTVWRAEHVKLGTAVAIKLISPTMEVSAEVLARFARKRFKAGCRGSTLPWPGGQRGESSSRGSPCGLREPVLDAVADDDVCDPRSAGFPAALARHVGGWRSGRGMVTAPRAR